MFDWLRGRTIRIEEHANPGGPPTKNYQYIRTASTKSQIPPSAAPTPAPVPVRRPPLEAEPEEDNFHPLEGDDVHLPSFQRRIGAGQYHPLPPIIHQQRPRFQHNNQPQFDAIEPPPPNRYLEWSNGNNAIEQPPPNRHLEWSNGNNAVEQPPPNRHLEWSNGDNATFRVNDHHERAVARLPKRDKRGQRVVRVHRPLPHRGSLSRNTSRARSGSGKYYSSYYDGSGGSRSSRDWDDSDSWAGGSRGTVKSGEWSDGGDSWDEGRKVRRSRRIENGRRDGRKGYYLN